MANEYRLRANWATGAITDNPLTSGAVAMHSTELAALPVIDSTNYAALTLNPTSTNPEIVWVTSHAASATVATIVRARENTSPQQFPAGTRWVHAMTSYDFNYLKTPMTRLYAKANFR